MRIGILSDIHGNLAALEAVRRDMERRQVDRVVNLGDVVFRGPNPEECLRLVRQMGAPVVLGNTEEWVTGEAGHLPAPIPEVRAWTRARLQEEELAYLAALPREVRLEAGGRRLLFVHGSPRSNMEFLFPGSEEQQLREALEGCEADIVVCGHSHWAFSRRVGDVHLIGAGSVGLPFDGDPRASYAVLEVTEEQVSVTHIRLEYDRERTLAAAAERDFPDLAFLRRVVMTGSNQA